MKWLQNILREIFGLFVDDCKDPYSAGVMGMRLALK